LLKDKAPGTFLIRDSNNFPGAYGLALKVDKPPANVQIKPGSDPANELVRHFLIEPTTKGVRIKGCCNEPVFGSLAALVYQHSITPLALPIKLVLPTQDLMSNSGNNNNNNINGYSNGESVKTGKQIAQSVLSPDGRLLLEKGAGSYFFLFLKLDSTFEISKF
jgi:tensin